MFSLFKKKQENKTVLKAIVSGKVIPLEEVPEEAFASKALGDGVAYNPGENTIFSPCDCTVTMMNSGMKHAIGLKLSNGLELLIHVGIDTVKLNGHGFEQLAKEGAKVKAGQPLLKFDRDFIKENGYSNLVMFIISDLGSLDDAYKLHFGDMIQNENTVIEWL